MTALPELELVAATWGEPLAWEIFCNERYSFAVVSALADKTGQVQQLVNEKVPTRKSSASPWSTRPWARTPTACIAR